MSIDPGGLARLSAANERNALRSLEPHLEPDEEMVLNAALRPNRGWTKRLRFARLHVEPASVELPDYCVVAVTSRRFFVVSHDLSGEHVSAMLMGAPLDEVRSVRHEGARVSWDARGTQYVLWTNKRFSEQVARALQREPASSRPAD